MLQCIIIIDKCPCHSCERFREILFDLQQLNDQNAVNNRIQRVWLDNFSKRLVIGIDFYEIMLTKNSNKGPNIAYITDYFVGPYTSNYYAIKEDIKQYR